MLERADSFTDEVPLPVDDIPIRKDTEGRFSRHLLGLCMTVEQATPMGGTTTTFRAYPGTVLGIGRWLFFLTAGHVLLGIDEALDGGTASIEHCVLADLFRGGYEDDQTLPFDYVHSPRLYIYKEGVDFGVIGLGRHYQNWILSNGIMPIDEIQWQDLPRVFDQYEFVGFPAEVVIDRRQEQAGLVLVPVVISVKEHQGLPAGMTPSAIRSFYGLSPKSIPPLDISGMSGGPIFGIVNGPTRWYRPIAVQTAWLSESKVIAACKIDEIATIISAWLQANHPGGQDSAF